ncbi:MAG: hypothetical protein KUG79_15160 [Pseudomonadales bacterium]|nr:hypothetical protein [Pseudomonadales bacterium]
MEGIPAIGINSEAMQLDNILAEIRQVILKHPVAAQAAYSSLLAEGKRFAATEAGKVAVPRVKNSELANRLRLVWELSSGWMLDEKPQGPLPSSFIDAIFLAANENNIDELLKKLYSNTVPGD